MKHVEIMEYVKGCDIVPIQFQWIKVENVEEKVQKKNHVTESYAKVSIFAQVLHSSLCKSLEYQPHLAARSWKNDYYLKL